MNMDGCYTYTESLLVVKATFLSIKVSLYQPWLLTIFFNMWGKTGDNGTISSTQSCYQQARPVFPSSWQYRIIQSDRNARHWKSWIGRHLPVRYVLVAPTHRDIDVSISVLVTSPPVTLITAIGFTSGCSDMVRLQWPQSCFQFYFCIRQALIHTFFVIEAKTNETPFHRRHFQMNFIEWKCMNSD